MNIEHDDEEEKIPEVTPETIIEDEEPPAYQPAEGLPYRPELSNLSKMYQTWFLDYASYVILERAVPHIDDGLKPVQRRILYNLKRMDSGKLIKVANIVGETMKYHPHGDASINDALVQLGQKGFLIDTQGNWGNILTGDPAAAGRYIEAKLSAFAHEAVYSDRVTPWKKTYDGTTDEPVALPVKFPLYRCRTVLQDPFAQLRRAGRGRLCLPARRGVHALSRLPHGGAHRRLPLQ